MYFYVKSWKKMITGQTPAVIFYLYEMCRVKVWLILKSDENVDTALKHVVEIQYSRKLDNSL